MSEHIDNANSNTSNSCAKIILLLIATIVILVTTLLYMQWGRWDDISFKQQFVQVQQLVEDKEWEQVELYSYTLLNDLKQHIDNNPDSDQNFEYWMMMGEILLYNGQLKAASASYNKANKLKPNDQFIQSRLAQLKQIELAPSRVDNTNDTNDQPNQISAFVRIDDSMKQQPIPENAVVFAFIRQYQGASMPVAIKRLRVGQLPTTVSLSETDKMIQSALWDEKQQYEWVVRISHSGDAIPKTGDLQGVYGPVNLGDSVNVVVNQRID